MMIHVRKALAAGWFLAATLGIVSGTRAQTFAEPGDAGETLAAAAVTSGSSANAPLTTITGSFNGGSDADLYVITISSPGTFSATTVNATTEASGVDTALFLMDVNGTPVATNDDASGTSTDSTFPAGNSLYANLAAGKYYLGVSQSGNEPVNTNRVLLFAAYPSGDTTAIRGPAANLSPAAESTFNGLPYSGTTGSYEIDLTGVEYSTTAVPEPGAGAALLLAAAAAVLAAARRRRTRGV